MAIRDDYAAMQQAQKDAVLRKARKVGVIGGTLFVILTTFVFGGMLFESVAQALQAVQAAVTAEATGRANVATARANEEIDKTKAVVQGEKMRDVANLKSQEAAFYKTEQILRADADSEYKRRIMQADNALTQRLEAYKYGVDKISAAIAKQPMVPQIVIGGGSSGSQTSALDAIMGLVLAGQAKAVGLDLTPKQEKQ